LLGCAGVDPRTEDLFAEPGPRVGVDAQGGVGLDGQRKGGADGSLGEGAPNGLRDGTTHPFDAGLSSDRAPSIEPDGGYAVDVASGGADDHDRPVADGEPVDAAERDRNTTACVDKRVFVTTKALPNGGFSMGSVAEADRFCQAAADERHFGGTWRAWISDSHSSPAARFATADAVYRLLDGTLVASTWVELTSGTLAHAIDLMDSGMWVPLQARLEVWTGTAPTGSFSGYDCADWTNTSPNLPYADVGTVGRKDNGWTQAYRQFCDRTNIHLYCFEQ
jgi:hypothetical protein